MEWIGCNRNGRASGDTSVQLQDHHLAASTTSVDLTREGGREGGREARRREERRKARREG